MTNADTMDDDATGGEQALALATFELGDLPLLRGGVLRDARLAYATWGRPNADGSNVVVLPTSFGATPDEHRWLVEPGGVLDPERWFVVSPQLFGAGRSTSPSNAHPSQRGAAWPLVHVYDDVAAQLRLVRALGGRSVALVAGFSMGAQQAFHWAAAEPDLVAAIVPWCGSARTAEHNLVFLESVEATLRADPAYANGAYDAPPVTGQRAVGRVWAGWGFSQTFYRERRWRELGFSSREAFVDKTYVASFSALDANDLLAMLHTWMAADVGAHPRYDGDTAAALAAIRARAIVMPSRSDLYFPPEDSVLEVAAMADAELCVIDSDVGHAGGAIDPEAKRQVAAAIARALAR